MTLASNGLANAVPYRWTYADATARTSATGFVSTDVGALALQQSDNSLWLLTATTPTWTQLSGGGGGATIGSGTLASRPAAGTAGNLYLPTDAPYLYRDNGSAWQAFGRIQAMTPPVAANFSWVNQGSASFGTNGGVLSMLAPASTSDNLRLLVKSIPSAPYTITAALVTNSQNVNYLFGGLVLRDSASGKLIVLEQFTNGGFIGLVNYNSPTSQSGTQSGSKSHGNVGLVWFQIQDDNTNRTFRASADGTNWYQIYSGARTTFITPDQVGFFLDASHATADATMTVYSYLETSP